jgi:hypothetical protein
VAVLCFSKRVPVKDSWSSSSLVGTVTMPLR